MNETTHPHLFICQHYGTFHDSCSKFNRSIGTWFRMDFFLDSEFEHPRIFRWILI